MTKFMVFDVKLICSEETELANQWSTKNTKKLGMCQSFGFSMLYLQHFCQSFGKRFSIIIRSLYMIADILYLFEYNAHSCITRTELFVGVFGTKCCALYSNKYGNLFI